MLVRRKQGGDYLPAATRRHSFVTCVHKMWLLNCKFRIRQFIELDTLRTSLPSEICDLCAALDPYSSLDDKKVNWDQQTQFFPQLSKIANSWNTLSSIKRRKWIITTLKAIKRLIWIHFLYRPDLQSAEILTSFRMPLVYLKGVALFIFSTYKNSLKISVDQLIKQSPQPINTFCILLLRPWCPQP